MKKKTTPNKIEDTDMALNYLAETLVDAFLDKMVDEDPNFKDPRINQPIYDLIKESKKRKRNIIPKSYKQLI